MRDSHIKHLVQHIGKQTVSIHDLTKDYDLHTISTAKNYGLIEDINGDLCFSLTKLGLLQSIPSQADDKQPLFIESSADSSTVTINLDSFRGRVSISLRDNDHNIELCVNSDKSEGYFVERETLLDFAQVLTFWVTEFTTPDS